MSSPRKILNTLRINQKALHSLGMQCEDLFEKMQVAEAEAIAENLLVTPKLLEAQELLAEARKKYQAEVARFAVGKQVLPDALRESGEDVNVEEVFELLGTLDTFVKARAQFKKDRQPVDPKGLRDLAAEAVTAQALYEASREEEKTLFAELDLEIERAHALGIRRTPESEEARKRAKEGVARTLSLGHSAWAAKFVATRSALREYSLGARVLPAQAVWTIAMTAEDYAVSCWDESLSQKDARGSKRLS
jgi:hypothetical protein